MCALRTRRIIEVDLKTPSRPPAFAFIEFDSSRAAEDAVAGRDSYDFHGERLRVRSTLITSNTSAWQHIPLDCFCLRRSVDMPCRLCIQLARLLSPSLDAVRQPC